MVARRVPGRRQARRPRHRQRRAPQGGRVRRRPVRQARPQAGGHRGFIQPVQFKSKTIDEAKSALALVRGERSTPLALGADAIISLRVDPAPTVEAAARVRRLRPEQRRGRARRLRRARRPRARSSSSSPVPRARSPAPWPRTCSRPASAGTLLRKLGAVGTMTIANPKNVDIPWERSSLARFLPSMSLADPMMDDNRGLSDRRRDQPGAGRQGVRGVGPHLRRDPRRGRHQLAPPPSSPARSSGHRRRDADRRRPRRTSRRSCRGPTRP